MSANQDMAALKQENERLKKELEIAALTQKNCEVRLEAATLAAQKVRRPWIFQKESWAALGGALIVLIPVYQQWRSAAGKVSDAQAQLNDALIAKTNALNEVAQAKSQYQKTTSDQSVASARLTELNNQIAAQQKKLDDINKSMANLAPELIKAASQLNQAKAKIKQPQQTALALSDNVNSAYDSIAKIEKEANIINPLVNLKMIRIDPTILRLNH
jgi:uncharacterized coiled-coil protein SlyX